MTTPEGASESVGCGSHINQGRFMCQVIALTGVGAKMARLALSVFDHVCPILNLSWHLMGTGNASGVGKLSEVRPVERYACQSL